MAGLVKDPEFNLNRTEEFKLSIQVSLNGFSFSVVHEKQKKLLVLENYPLKISTDKFLERHLNEWINNNEILKKNYSAVNLSYYSKQITFVPSEYFEADKLQLIGTLTLGNQDDKIFAENNLKNANGHIIYPVCRALAENMKSKFPNAILQHPVSILDNEVFKLPSLNESKLALYFEEKSFNLLLYSNSHPLVINSYGYESFSDIIFYVLSALKKVEQIPEETTLLLSGNISHKSGLHSNLKKYFRRTVYLTPDVHYNSDLFKEPLHRYIVLF